MIRRIALVSVHASPLVELGSDKAGGMNVYVREVAREFGRQGVEVDIYTAGLGRRGEIDYSLGEWVRVVSVPIDLDLFVDPVEFYPLLSQFVDEILAIAVRFGVTYDLIYSHYWLSGWVAHRLRVIWGTPFVHMFHTLGYMKSRVASLEVGKERSESSDVRVMTEEKILQWADGIVAATPAERAQLIWLYRANREKIEIVSPGVDLGRFYPVEDDVTSIRAHLGIPEGRELLLFVGRLEPLKAVDVVLEALRLINVDKPFLLENLRFVVIGGGDVLGGNLELDRLKKLCVKLGVSELVDFVGSKDQLVLVDYFRVAQAVIVPSDYESFGMVALEAMACGALVIASGVGGLAYLVSDGEAGWLVPARDSTVLAERLEFLICNPEIRSGLARSAAQLAQQYSWARVVGRLLYVFQGFAASAFSPRRS